MWEELAKLFAARKHPDWTPPEADLYGRGLENSQAQDEDLAWGNLSDMGLMPDQKSVMNIPSLDYKAMPESHNIEDRRGEYDPAAVKEQDAIARLILARQLRLRGNNDPKWRSSYTDADRKVEDLGALQKDPSIENIGKYGDMYGHENLPAGMSERYKQVLQEELRKAPMPKEEGDETERLW